MQVSGDNFIKERAFSRLTSRDSNKFWTAGQWMTERRGGSDVGNDRKNKVNKDTD